MNWIKYIKTYNTNKDKYLFVKINAQPYNIKNLSMKIQGISVK